MTFREREDAELVEYNGKTFKTWRVEVSPGHYSLFADIRLQDELEANGETGNWLDDKIAWYADLDDDVDEAIEDFND